MHIFWLICSYEQPRPHSFSSSSLSKLYYLSFFFIPVEPATVLPVAEEGDGGHQDEGADEAEGQVDGDKVDRGIHAFRTYKHVQVYL